MEDTYNDYIPNGFCGNPLFFARLAQKTEITRNSKDLHSRHSNSPDRIVLNNPFMVHSIGHRSAWERFERRRENEPLQSEGRKESVSRRSPPTTQTRTPTAFIVAGVFEMFHKSCSVFLDNTFYNVPDSPFFILWDR